MLLHHCFKPHTYFSAAHASLIATQVYISQITPHLTSGVICTEQESFRSLLPNLIPKSLPYATQVDTFQITCRDIGHVRSIKLDSNGMSSKPNWHLDYIVLQVRCSGQ